jgi:hypothetical protein
MLSDGSVRVAALEVNNSGAVEVEKNCNHQYISGDNQTRMLSRNEILLTPATGTYLIAGVETSSSTKE